MITGAVNLMSLNDTDLKLLSNIKSHIKALKPVLPNRAVVTVGQYALDLADIPSIQGVQTDLIRVHHKKDLEYKTIIMDSNLSMEIDTEYEPHYWFDLKSQTDEEEIRKNLERKIFRYHKDLFTVTNLGEGTAAGLLPLLHRYFNNNAKNSIALGIFPSMTHSSDALFNAFSCTGMISLENTTPMLFFDQGKLEQYVGVHRGGDALEGVEALDYLLEVLLEKNGFLRDFYTISRNFDLKYFMPLMATGCSLEIYDNFRNILEISLEQPLMDVDISTSSLIYVLVRSPASYSDEFTKGFIEYEVSRWLNESLGIDIPQMVDTIFKPEYGDRIDVIMLLGGFDAKPMLERVYDRIKRFSQMNLDQNLIQPEYWNKLKKNLLED